MTNDTRQILPFDSAWPSVANALQHHSSLVLVAEPGAGKTTRLPARIIAEKISNRVAVLEPRRIAARAAASRIVSEWSSELGWKLGGEVGYSVRFDHRMTDATRLQFFTEGLFLKRLASNPTLQGIDCVVLDEFHERSRYTDLALALLKELQFLERPDLRIIVMSATMDAQKVADFLSPDTPIIHVPGRTFPIDVRHSGEPLSLVADRAWIDRVVRLVRSVANGTNPRIGDILTFLPGVGEIRRVEEALLADAGLARACRVLQLHGSLSLEEQNSVLVPSANDPRPRIILSTNIAETSLTLDGVGTVIDTGLARVSRSDRLGFSRLHLERISLASARQRAGRAGRQAPGICYRLWSKADELSFSEFDEAELSRIDLADSLLDLYALGVPDPRQFEWFESPDRSRIERSLELLRTLGAIDSNSRLTTLGRAMHQTGAPTRAAKLLVAANSMAEKGFDAKTAQTYAALLATLLSEKDFLLDSQSLQDSAHEECDLYLRARLLAGDRDHHARLDRAAMSTMKRILRSQYDVTDNALRDTSANWNEKLVFRLLLEAFPDRVARRRRPKAPQARMVGSKGIELHASSSVRDAEFFFALRGDAGVSRTSGDPLTTLASSFRREWLEEASLQTVEASQIGATKQQALYRKRDLFVFDEENLTVYRERAWMYRDLPLQDGHRERANADDAFELLRSEAEKRMADIQTRNEAVLNLLSRLRFLNITPQDIAAVWNDAVAESLFGETSLQALVASESDLLAKTLERKLFEQREQFPSLERDLRETAPSHFTAPTGNRFRIHYPENQSPYTEVRLQELFGTSKHPMIGKGDRETPLTFHLLGPNYRPVQVTSDLPGFWKGSYFEVRKELRARYPKHSWPENPLEAPAVAKGRRY